MTATMELPEVDPTDTVDKILAERSLGHFIRQCWHVIEPSAKLVWGRYNDALCEHLEAVTNGKINNLVITIPPGCTKSITVSVCWPAWMWITNPGVRWLTAANDLDLVLRDAVSCRELILSDWYQERWGDRFKIVYDQNVKNWYKNDRKGFRTAVTVGQKVTGKKGDIELIDDPDDAMNVRSEVERKKRHDWFDKAFYNRVNNHKTARRAVIGQRLDTDDLIGHILKRGDFVHLNLPEEFEPSERCTTPIGWSDWRQHRGELLRPELFGEEQVREAKSRLRTSYNGQHNQKPIVEGGYKFKAEWLRYYRISDTGQFWMFNEKAYEPREITDRFITVDPAFTEKKTMKDDPDYLAISAWGKTKCGKVVWLGCRRYQCEMPEGVDHVWQMYSRYGARKARIETGGTQKGFYQLCQRHSGHMNCTEFKPTTDKLDVAGDLFSIAEAGRLWLPANDPGFPLGEVESELLSFPGGNHDDIVTTASIMGMEVGNRDARPKHIKMGGVMREGLVG